MMMMSVKFLLAICMAGTLCAHELPSFLYTDFCAIEDLSVIKEYEVPRSYIAIVHDKMGKKYIIKQHKRDDAKIDLLCVREILGAYIAEFFGIPSNKVRLIPANVNAPGKRVKGHAATMHEFIEGKFYYMVRKFEKIKKSFSLRQLYSRAPSEKEYGLTELVIESMALHRDFPRIVALDTFLGICDRKTRNMIYDEAKDLFYFIDFDNACVRDMCYWAIVRLKEIIEDGCKNIGRKEFEALVLYKRTLQKIVREFPPEQTDFLMSSLFKKSKAQETAETIFYLKKYQHNLHVSYVSAEKLIDVLREVFAVYNKKLGFYH
jgi:hypothetical protein